MNNPTAVAVNELVQTGFRQYGGTECDSIILRDKKMMLKTETTIDKSYDQTAEHTHFRGIECPTCKSADCIGAEPEAGSRDQSGGVPFPPVIGEPFSRPVPSAILEHSVLLLERDLKETRMLHTITIKERDQARIRIKQMERFNAEVSVKVDEMLVKLTEATGEDPIELLFPNYKKAEAA